MTKIYGKADLISDLIQRAGISRAQAEGALDAIASVVRTQTAAGLTVVLPGVGRFTQKTRAARVGRNPQTGTPIDIPETNVLTFKASKAAS